MSINLEISTSIEPAVLAELHAVALPPGWSAYDFAQMLSVKGTEVVLAKKGDTLAGFALIRKIDEVMEILTLAVLPRYQRQGIGEQLCERLEKWAKEQKAVSILLEVRQSNKAAIELYTKRGFKAQSLRKDYYRNEDNSVEHAVIMSLTL